MSNCHNVIFICQIGYLEPFLCRSIFQGPDHFDITKFSCIYKFKGYWPLCHAFVSLCLPQDVVCLSVRPSVRPSVRHTFVSALYFLNPRWDFQITLHKCQVWWDDVRCLWLTKVGSRSRSQFKIKHCMTVFRVSSISFETLVGFTNNFAQISSMIRRCAVT